MGDTARENGRERFDKISTGLPHPSLDNITLCGILSLKSRGKPYTELAIELLGSIYIYTPINVITDS